MSRKSNRLKNRLRIEREKLSAFRRVANGRSRVLEAEAVRIDQEQKNLDRSVALRIRVERNFTQPIGPPYGLNIMFHPEEFRYQALRGGPNDMLNRTRFAQMRGRDIGDQIAQVILRCLNGELEEFARAK